MASIIESTFLSFIISTSILTGFSSTIIEDLNLPPPPDFRITIFKNCIKNPSLRYCNALSGDLLDVFKSTVVARHLCNISNNQNCNTSFTKIDLQARPSIAPLFLSFTFFWKYCPLTILTIDLSNNSLKGTFPADILYCSQIESLDLSYNDLIGEIPVETFSHLTNLTFLNLSFNHFRESNISEDYFFQRFNASSFLHSGLLPKDRKFKTVSIILLICLLTCTILMVGCFGWMCLQRPDLLPLVFQRKHEFTPAILKAATDGFSEGNLIKRKGGRTEIYGGVLRDGIEVIIETQRGKFTLQSRRDFVEECRTLVQLRHKNLVPLLGWCDRREFRAVVTRWIDGETVETWLSRSPPWKQRLKVLMEVIRTMCYLQEQWPQVKYDLTISSLVLTDSLRPLISRVKVQNKKNSSKEVYKLGVFLLELVAQKHNKHSNKEFKEGKLSFVELMKQHYPSQVQKVIDERMKTSTSFEQVKQMIGIGLMCTNSSNHQQPSLHLASKMIDRVYKSSVDSASPPQKQKK